MDRTKETEHFGIDFGVNATVIAAKRGSSGEPVLISFPGISEEIQGCAKNTSVPIIPSIIGYQPDGSFSIGKGSESPLCTDKTGKVIVKRLAYYLLEDSQVRVRTGEGRYITYQQACSDFLLKIIESALVNPGASGVKIMVTRPLDAPLPYRQWIANLTESVGGEGTISSVDIVRAAARGYGLPFRKGEMYILIDFNPESLDVAAVLPEPDIGDYSCSSRIIGRATTGFDGLGPDAWVASQILEDTGIYHPGREPGGIQLLLVQECRRARHCLSLVEETRVQITSDQNPPTHSRVLTRGDLEKVYHKHDLHTILERTISRALSAAHLMGYTCEEITSVLMIGELSTVPVLQDTVRRLFPGQLVRCEHALDAAARGAALESVSLTEECIKNDYALHYRDSATGDHRYRFLVRNGSRYPSAGEVARVLISAAYDGQVCLGIPLCLIPRNAENGREAGIELVGDPHGGMRLAGPASGCRTESRPVQVNKNEPTLLIATPPARKGEPRFELAFTIDRQRYLCVTVRDLMTGVLVKDAARMYRLI